MTRGRWWLLGSLYTTQTLGPGFFLLAFTAILRESGASLDQIGMIYALGIFAALKFLWAPAVDRWRLGQRQAHYRGWLLTMQSGMFATLLLVAQLDLGTQFLPIFALSMFCAFFSATQDVAVDTLACRLLAPQDGAMGNAIQGAGNMLGFMIGGGLVLMAYPYAGWKHSLWLLAAGVAMSWLQLPWFREPAWPAPTQMPRFAYLRRFWDFWRESGDGWHWPLLLALYGAGVSLAYALMPPMLVDAGWPLDRIGLAINVFGSLVGMAAAVLAGWAMRRMSRRQAVAAALVQVVAVAAVAIPVAGWTSPPALWLMIGLYFFCYAPATTVICTLMMDRASREAPATDYSLQYGLHFMSFIAVGAAGLLLAERLGYGGVLALLLAFAAVAMAWLYRPHPRAQADPRTAAPATDFVPMP